jgi:hypothetical protein
MEEKLKEIDVVANLAEFASQVNSLEDGEK